MKITKTYPIALGIPVTDDNSAISQNTEIENIDKAVIFWH